MLLRSRIFIPHLPEEWHVVPGVRATQELGTGQVGLGSAFYGIYEGLGDNQCMKGSYILVLAQSHLTNQPTIFL